MLSTKLKFISFAVVLFAAAAILLVSPNLRGESAPASLEDLQKQMEAVKAEIENGNNSPAIIKSYGLLADALGTCNTVNAVTEPTINAPFAPLASLCINGALAVTDPSWQRPATQSTGSGIQAGCPLTVGANKEYDVYSFNLTGCTVFPTEITATTCGPAGCTHLGNTDTIIFLYRNVPAGRSFNRQRRSAGSI